MAVPGRMILCPGTQAGPASEKAKREREHAKAKILARTFGEEGLYLRGSQLTDNASPSGVQERHADGTSVPTNFC